MNLKSKKSKYPYQVLIVDIVIFIVVLAIGIFANETSFVHKTTSPSMAIYIPLFIFIMISFGMYLYVEYKYNHLKLKNIFLIIWAAITIANIIAISTLPNVINLPNNQQLTIDGATRGYCILLGTVIAAIPYIAFYLVPRKFLTNKYLKIIFILGLIFVGFLCIFSYIKEGANYIYLITHKFEGAAEHSISSVFPQKNLFGKCLFAGICICIYLHISLKNWKWLIPIPIFFITMIFSMSKMNLLVSIFVIVIYTIIRLIFLMRKSKENAIIIGLIFGFVVLFAAIISVLTINSTAGFFYKFKNFINSTFIEIGEKTFASRQIIWDCAIKLLSPLQIVFGFGFGIFGSALHMTYAHDPRLPEWENLDFIYTAHNAEIEMLGRGGIIYLLSFAIILIYLIYIMKKMYKKNPLLVCCTSLFLIAFILYGIVDSDFITNTGTDLLMTCIIVCPIMCAYFKTYDQNEKKTQNEIIAQSKKIKNENYKNKLLQLNKKRLLYTANTLIKEKALNSAFFTKNHRHRFKQNFNIKK